MEWKLFLSTFALIFLAELGDKTQLAALAASAGSRSPASVFAGAATALVASTLVAVLIGASFARLVPAHLVRAAAGVVFLAFGLFFLHSAWRPARAAEAVSARFAPSALGELVLYAAAGFEQAAAEDYEALADAARDEETKALLRTLAAQERAHVEHLHEAAHAHGTVRFEARVPRPPGRMAALPRRAHPGPLDKAIRHEQETVAFYRELARAAPFERLREVFEYLAFEETEHLRRLEALAVGPQVDSSDA